MLDFVPEAASIIFLSGVRVTPAGLNNLSLSHLGRVCTGLDSDYHVPLKCVRDDFAFRSPMGLLKVVS